MHARSTRIDSGWLAAKFSARLPPAACVLESDRSKAVSDSYKIYFSHSSQFCDHRYSPPTEPAALPDETCCTARCAPHPASAILSSPRIPWSRWGAGVPPRTPPSVVCVHTWNTLCAQLLVAGANRVFSFEREKKLLCLFFKPAPQKSEAAAAAGRVLLQIGNFQSGAPLLTGASSQQKSRWDFNTCIVDTHRDTEIQ